MNHILPGRGAEIGPYRSGFCLFRVGGAGQFAQALNRFDDGARVDEAALRSAGLANGRGAGIKILGEGELTRKLTVSAHAFSASAKAKIEAKGGACELVAPKSPAPAKLEAGKP